MYKRQVVNPVSASSAYNDDQKIEFGFMAHRISLHYRSGTNNIKFSTNGSDDIAELGGDVNEVQSVEITEPSTELWYTNGSGDEIIEITAFSTH